MSIHRFGIALTILLGSSTGLSAAEWDVPGDFSSIQAAVLAAAAGDVITVAPGTYTGRLDFRGKDVVVQSSDGPEHTIIDGGGMTSCVLFLQGETNDAVLDGFTVTGGRGSMHESFLTGGGIHIVNSSPSIRNCVLRNNTAHFGGGIAIWEGSPSIENCVFEYNHASGDGGGLRLHYYTTAIIRDCVFFENTADVFGGGITYGHYSEGQQIDCIFDGNTAGLRGGAISSACDCNDPRLIRSSFCNSVPDHILGGWQDFGGNDFCAICDMDVTADGVVDVNDILQVIAAWGGCICVEDVDGDTVVGVDDLLAVIAAYGDCPS